MPIYISRGRFTSDAVKGMLARPENREEAVAKLFKSVGGRLIGWYLTFGHHDWMAIAEFPDEKVAASAILAADCFDAVDERQKHARAGPYDRVRGLVPQLGELGVFGFRSTCDMTAPL
jgi:uncharacterized protein with GYD domain